LGTLNSGKLRKLQKYFDDLRSRTDTLCVMTSEISKAIPNELSSDFGWAEQSSSLTEHMKSLEGHINRAEKPEIRVLFFGPLKSGKSTLMNILTRNPKVSQVDPRPAYPCFIEVRHEDIDSPICGLFKGFEDLDPTETLTLAKTRDRLDNLLEEFIQGSQEFNRCNLIKIQMRLWQNSGEGELVLIDSPGLLFGNSRYTKELPTYLTKADVAVYVVRVEQLFTAEVNKHIKDVREKLNDNEKMRFYVIVNGTRKALKFNDNGEQEYYDQIEHSGEYKKYLYTHVLDTDTVGKVENPGSEMKLDFADLLQEWDNVRHGSADRSTKAAESSKIIVSLEKYLGEDLLAQKMNNLETLCEKCKEKFIEDCKSGEKLLNNLLGKKEGELQNTSAKIKSNGADRLKLKEDIENLKGEIKHIERLIEDLTSQEEIPQQDSDWGRILQIFKSVEPSENECVMSIVDIARHCSTAYEIWFKTANRTLQNLSKEVWEGKPEDDKGCLRDLWSSKGPSICRNIRNTAEIPESERHHKIVQSAKKNLEPKRDWFIRDNMALKGSGQLKIIPLDYRVTGLERAINPSRWRDAKVPDIELWGIDGSKEMDMKVAKRKKEIIIRGMLKEGWNLQDLADPYKCKEMVLKVIQKHLSDELSKAAIEKEGVLKTDLTDKEKQLNELESERIVLTKRERELLSLRENLENKLTKTKELQKVAEY